MEKIIMMMVKIMLIIMNIKIISKMKKKIIIATRRIMKIIKEINLLEIVIKSMMIII